MKFATIKGQITFFLNKKLAKSAFLAARPFAVVTDFLFEHMK